MRLYNQDYSLDVSPRPDGTHTMRIGPPPQHEPPPPKPCRKMGLCGRVLMLTTAFAIVTAVRCALEVLPTPWVLPLSSALYFVAFLILWPLTGRK